MQLLTSEELNMIKGGFSILNKIMILGGLITFIIGFIDGLIRPLKCNS